MSTTSVNGNGYRPAGSGLFDSITVHEDGTQRRGPITNIRRLAGNDRPPGTVLLAAASALLLFLAVAQGYVSWFAQYGFIFRARHASLASGLEALGLDAAALIFALLGLAHARMGKPARVERTLNAACALGSMVMNILAANMGSPRSIAVFVLPPLLYVTTSDRLIAVAGSLAGVREVNVWRTVGAAAPYALRLVLAPPSTARGLRRIALAAAPLPDSPHVVVAANSTQDQNRETATADGVLDCATVPALPAPQSGRDRLIALYREHPEYGRRGSVARAAADLADMAGLSVGTARNYLGEHLRRRP